MKKIIYTARTPVVQEPYTHRLVGYVLAAAAHRNYMISLQVPDKREEINKSLLFKLASINTKEIEIMQSSTDLPTTATEEGEILFFAGSLDYWRLFVRAPFMIRRYRKLFWFQGIESEESYLKHGSLIRRSILSKIEAYALKASSIIICPSDAMIQMLLKRYPFLKTKNFITIPNLADNTPQPVRDASLWGFEKPPRLALGYLGGLSEWQCFEETCRIVSEVQKYIPDAWFLVLTKETNRAEYTLNLNGVTRYRLRSATTEDAEQYVASFDLGFMLRRDNTVNRVACPMKWLEYWKCGVPLITTRAVEIIEQASAKTSNCLIDLNNIPDAAQNVIAWFLRPESQRRTEREELIKCVKEKWTWTEGLKLTDKIFEFLDSKSSGRRYFWIS